ncbi:MAG TPA: HAD-IA family hydrolase [Cellulomonas sp.]
MSLDAVLFDLGNVLVGWQWRAALHGVLTDDEADRFVAEADFEAVNRRLDAGWPWDEAVAHLAARDPWLGRVLAEYRHRYPLSLTGPVPGMTELVGELRLAGLRLVGLTNWSAEMWPHAVPAAPVIGSLDGVVVSGVEGVAKPDPRIFRLAAGRYGLEPARTLFVDDHGPHVAAALALGFEAVVFTGADSLRGELVGRGVPVGAP